MDSVFVTVVFFGNVLRPTLPLETKHIRGQHFHEQNICWRFNPCYHCLFSQR